MTTIVNNPSPVVSAPAAAQESSGSGFLIGAIILIGFVGLLLYFGIPAIKRMGPAQINIPAPQVVIPDKINVEVNQGN